MLFVRTVLMSAFVGQLAQRIGDVDRGRLALGRWFVRFGRQNRCGLYGGVTMDIVMMVVVMMIIVIMMLVIVRVGVVVLMLVVVGRFIVLMVVMHGVVRMVVVVSFIRMGVPRLARICRLDDLA